MMNQHLAADAVALYVEQGLDALTRAETDAHIAACALCRGRVARDRRIEAALREMPRENPPRDLAARITATVELRVSREQMRRERLPLIAVATFFSALLMLWFGFEMLVTFQENGALDFFSLLASRPEVFSTYSTDALFALIESLPISEIVLTLFAVLTVVVLVQQWADSAQPRVSFNHNGHRM